VKTLILTGSGINKEDTLAVQISAVRRVCVHLLLFDDSLAIFPLFDPCVNEDSIGGD
jgi:hypothetical protein